MDFLIALYFWLVYEALSWPLRLALDPLGMRGDLKRMISRVAGPALIAMVAWFAAHFGIPLNPVTIFGWIAAAFVAGYFVARRPGRQIRIARVLSPVSRRHWKQDLAIELSGLFIFLGFVACRRYAPEMTSAGLNLSIGAEKFMNAMLFWSTWHARELPPEDYWLAGFDQTYYYWGHYFWAFIGRASLLPGEWIITLALARLVSLTYEAGYLLLRSLGLRCAGSVVGGLLIVCAGNPQGVINALDQYNYASGRMFESSDERGFILAGHYRVTWSNAPIDTRLGSYRYWEPSRVIENTITEFPAWTAVLGDFHAHHLSLPWLLAWLALVARGDRWFGLRRGKRNGESPNASGVKSSFDARAAVLFALVFSVLAAAALVSNLWVAPLIGVGSALIFIWRGWSVRSVAYRFALLGAMIAVGGGAALLIRPPAGADDSSKAAAQTSRAGEDDELETFLERLPVKRLPVEIETGEGKIFKLRSTDGELFRHWGFHAMVLGVAAIVAALVCGVSFARLAWLALSLVLIAIKLTFARDAASLWGFAAGALILSLAVGPRRWLGREAAIFGAGACILIACLELVFLDDPMVLENERYNSYFKFSFPAWPVVTAVAVVLAARLWHLRAPWPVRYPLRIALLAMIPFILTFLAFAMPARNLQASAGDRRGEDGTRIARRPTLDAFAWLANVPGYEAEAEMIDWIRNRVAPRERMAEIALYDAYRFNGRIASLAGRPVPVGWGMHESTWRGESGGAALAASLHAGRSLYEAPTPEAMVAAAHAMGVNWIIFGKVEREHFGEARAERIFQVLRAATLRDPPLMQLRAKFPSQAPRSFVFKVLAPQPEGG